MGEFKPLLPVGGSPAVLRAVRAAEEAGIRDITVVTGHFREKIESFLSEAAPNAQLIYNERYMEGMFSSVCAGASAVRAGTDGFFLLPADCCAVSSETLAALVRAFEKAGMEAVAHPAHKGRRGHPPLIPARFAGSIIAYKGGGGLRGCLEALPYIETETGDPGILLDMDTPDDYASLLEYITGDATRQLP